jgi:hypothetical protein
MLRNAYRGKWNEKGNSTLSNYPKEGTNMKKKLIIGFVVVLVTALCTIVTVAASDRISLDRVALTAGNLMQMTSSDNVRGDTRVLNTAGVLQMINDGTFIVDDIAEMLDSGVLTQDDIADWLEEIRNVTMNLAVAAAFDAYGSLPVESDKSDDGGFAPQRFGVTFSFDAATSEALLALTILSDSFSYALPSPTSTDMVNEISVQLYGQQYTAIAIILFVNRASGTFLGSGGTSYTSGGSGHLSFSNFSASTSVEDRRASVELWYDVWHPTAPGRSLHFASWSP